MACSISIMKKMVGDTMTKNYFDLYFDECERINDVFEVEDQNGTLHVFEKDAVREELKALPAQYQEQIKSKIAIIELRNPDGINHFIEYVLRGLLSC